MANRFTDTDKWKKSWFRKLKPIYKCFWQYLVDNCNHAGIWEVDFELASFCIGNELDLEETKSMLNKQYLEISNGKRWFIKDFIDFQYKGKLNPKNKAHLSVINILKKEGLRGYKGAIQAPKDKDKDKDKYKDIVKEIIEDFNIVFSSNYKVSNKVTCDLIVSRLNDDFTLEDFGIVHRKMLKNWGADAKMYKYLRPQTLYSNKFESYLNMREFTTKLTETGIKAYLIGQEWLKKQEIIDAK